MARVYVKGYTKSDGTKVEGHYRNYRRTAASSVRTEIRKGNVGFKEVKERNINKKGKVYTAEYKEVGYHGSLRKKFKKTGADKLLGRWGAMQRRRALR